MSGNRSVAITVCGFAPAELVASREPASGDSLSRFSVREAKSGDAMLVITALRGVVGVDAVECRRL